MRGPGEPLPSRPALLQGSLTPRASQRPLPGGSKGEGFPSAARPARPSHRHRTTRASSRRPCARAGPDAAASSRHQPPLSPGRSSVSPAKAAPHALWPGPTPPHSPACSQPAAPAPLARDVQRTRSPIGQRVSHAALPLVETKGLDSSRRPLAPVKRRTDEMAAAAPAAGGAARGRGATSFQRKAAASSRLAAVAGTRPSVRHGQLLLSSGLPSLDCVLGWWGAEPGTRLHPPPPPPSSARRPSPLPGPACLLPSITRSYSRRLFLPPHSSRDWGEDGGGERGRGRAGSVSRLEPPRPVRRHGQVRPLWGPLAGERIAIYRSFKSV